MALDPVRDPANLTPTVEALVGTRPTQAELDAFPFRLYRFVLQAIRAKDQAAGRVLERMLDGPQELWVASSKRTAALATLFEPENIEARFLRAALWLVGFTSELDYVTRNLVTAELRRLYSAAVPLWRATGTETGIGRAVRAATGNHFRIRNYFDFRMVLDEVVLTEEMEDFDPNVLSLTSQLTFRSGTDGNVTGTDRFQSASVTFDPGDVGAFVVVTEAGTLNRGFYEIAEVIQQSAPGRVRILGVFPTVPETDLEFDVLFPNDEFVTELRVADEDWTGAPAEGKVNRDLLENLIELVRLSSERVDVVYADFLDGFDVDNDLSQWQITGGVVTVQDGLMLVRSDGEVKSLKAGSENWKFFELVAKVRFSADPAAGNVGWSITFRHTVGDEGYQVAVDFFPVKQATLYRISDGTPLAGPVPLPIITAGVYDTFRFNVIDAGAGGNKIVVYFDGDEVLSATDASAVNGGYFHFFAGGDTWIEVDEVQMMLYPVDVARVGPNP